MGVEFYSTLTCDAGELELAFSLSWKDKMECMNLV